MAFTIQNWGRTSTHANEPTETANAVLVGAPREYTYQSADTQAVMSALNYFNGVANDLTVGDRISCYSTTESTWVGYWVSAITYGPTYSVTLSLISGDLVAQGTITNAQMLAGIYAHPVLIVPAPGANKVIVAQNATLSIVYATTQYQNGGATRFQYTATVHAGGTNVFGTTVAAADINAATANNFQLLIGIAQAWGLNTALGNQGIYLSCDTGEFTAGDSPLKYSFKYRVASLT